MSTKTFYYIFFAQNKALSEAWYLCLRRSSCRSQGRTVL